MATYTGLKLTVFSLIRCSLTCCVYECSRWRHLLPRGITASQTTAAGAD